MINGINKTEIKEFENIINDICFIVTTKYQKNKQQLFNSAIQKLLNLKIEITGLTTKYFITALREYKQQQITASEIMTINHLLKNSFLQQQPDALLINIENSKILYSNIFNNYNIEKHKPITEIKTTKPLNFVFDSDRIKELNQYCPINIKTVKPFIEVIKHEKISYEPITEQEYIPKTQQHKTDNYSVLLENINKEFN